MTTPTLQELIVLASKSDLEDKDKLAGLLCHIRDNAPAEDCDELRFMLAERLEDFNLLSESVSVLDSMSDWPGDRVSALARIAEHYFKKDCLEEARSCLGKATGLADSCDPTWLRAESFLAIAKAYRAIGMPSTEKKLLTKAVRLARAGEGYDGPQDSFDASGVLKEIAQYFSSTSRGKEGRAIAKRIKNFHKRRRALKWIREHGSG